MSKNILKNETKKEKFIRLAESRINNILEQYRKLGNLSNHRNYEYTENDVKKMFLVLNSSLKNTRNLFLNKGIQKTRLFKFKEEEE